MEYWLVIALLYAGLIAVIDVYKKWLLEENFDPLLILVHSQTLMGAAALSLILVWRIEIPWNTTLLGVSAITTLASWLLIEALRRDDVSVVGPVVSMTPLWVGLTEPFITDAEWSVELLIGTVVVVVGVYLILMEDNYLHPFSRISDIGVLLAIGASFCYAGVAVFQRQLLDGTIAPLGISLGTVVFSWIFFLVLWVVLRMSVRELTSIPTVIIPLAVFRLSTSLGFIRAVQGSDATTVEVIAQLSNLGSVAGGSLFGEEHLLKRGAGAVLIIVAVFIVV